MSGRLVLISDRSGITSKKADAKPSRSGTDEQARMRSAFTELAWLPMNALLITGTCFLKLLRPARPSGLLSIREPANDA